ncbi:MAG: sulfatase-like hydrolase/transferase [Candidatus Hydrogenedens sp.]|nr:sulfatase-like hydrolase/transferase [Candidatus Hydrogenedens sp.]
MFLPLYLFALSASSGLMGAFAHRLLGEQGFVPDMEASILFTVGVAALFAALQLGYMALLYFVAPARGGVPLVAESLGLLAAVVFLPYLLHLPLVDLVLAQPGIEIPSAVQSLLPKLTKVEPLIYLGLFLGLHGVFKLVGLFGAIQSRATTRLVVVAWAAGALLCGSAAQKFLFAYRDVLAEQSLAELPDATVTPVDQVYTDARSLTEGKLYTVPLEDPLGKQLVFYVAFPEAEADPPATLHLSLQVNGTSSQADVRAVTIAPTGWSTVTVSPVMIPADAKELQLLWSEEAEPAWVTRTGIRPLARSSRQLLVSGPHVSTPRSAETPPSVILIAVDGLGARHLSGMGYERPTTPRLDAWAKDASQYHECFSPSPDPAPALMSILTAQPPLRHGYIEGYRGPLPPDVTTLAEEFRRKGYATGALSEGESSIKGAPFASDLVYGSGFERGFDWFDQRYPVATTRNAQGLRVPGGFEPSGSHQTLEQARAFVEAHRTVPFFLFVRLRELAEPRKLARYGSTFYPENGSPAPVDMHDTAIQYVDTELGEFLDWLGEAMPKEHTAVAVTAPYGLDFSGRDGKAGRYLTEDSLHVPMYIRVPELTPRTRRTLVSTMDLAPALLGVAGGRFANPVLGSSVLEAATDRSVVSAMGEPLALSIRSRSWRLTWQSGLNPSTFERMEQEQYLDFISIDRFNAGQPQQNYWQSESNLAERYRERLVSYLKSFQEGGTPPTEDP